MAATPLSVVGFVLDDQQRCLLLRRSLTSSVDPGAWELPGGKCEAGETVEVALLREIAEETGLAVEVVGPVGTAHRQLPNGRIIVYLFMETRLTGDNEVRLSTAHIAHRWHVAADLGEIDVPAHLKKTLREFASLCRQRLGGEG